MALQLQKLLNNPAAQPFNSLANLVDLASTAGGMYVVAPQNIESEVYLFDTRGEEEAALESDITDNWIETNTTMQDHIGLKPMIITLSGYVGELTNKLPKELENLQKAEVSSKLSALSPFTPELTTQTQYILNRTQELYGIYEKANKTVSRIEEKLRGIDVPQGVNNQQAVFDKFYQLWEKRSLVTVYTPFGVFDNMAIMSLHARQDEETAYISEFRVSFKKIRIAGLMTTYTDEKKQREAIAAMPLSNQIDKGIKKPLESTLISGGRSIGKTIINTVENIMKPSK